MTKALDKNSPALWQAVLPFLPMKEQVSAATVSKVFSTAKNNMKPGVQSSKMAERTHVKSEEAIKAKAKFWACANVLAEFFLYFKGPQLNTAAAYEGIQPKHLEKCYKILKSNSKYLSLFIEKVEKKSAKRKEINPNSRNHKPNMMFLDFLYDVGHRQYPLDAFFTRLRLKNL